MNFSNKQKETKTAQLKDVQCVNPNPQHWDMPGIELLGQPRFMPTINEL